MESTVVFNTEVMNQVVHKTLRTAALLSFGTMVFPYAKDVDRMEVRAARAPPLKQWFLERESFDQKVAQQYSELTTGAVREIIAPTGVGKSTKLPYVIAKSHGVNGLVLTPNDMLPAHLIKYVRVLYAKLGGKVAVTVLRSAHFNQAVKTPCVYYASASTFLSRLAIRPTVLEELGIDFIYLDESHERVPAYLFFRYLLTAGIVGNVKVFYGTATGATDVVEQKQNVVAVPEDVMSVGTPKMATSRSPLHYRNITNPTLVVCALDSEIRMWSEYYEEHDVPAYPCYMEDGLKPMNGIDDFIRTNSICVILVTSMFRTGVTYPIETVVCTGYTAVLATDFTNGTVSLKRVPVTQSLRVQTMGRVDRIMPGKGYYADVQVTPEALEMDDDTAFYIYLWAKVFNLKINDPLVSVYGEVTGELSRRTAAVLLHGRVPPALLLPYLGDKGFYKCWSKFASCMLYSTVGTDVVSSEPVNVEHWAEYNTGPVDYADRPVTFKCAVRFPREWQCLPAIAWMHFMGSNARLDGLRPRSVVSAVSTIMPSQKARASTVTVASAVLDASTRFKNYSKVLPPVPSFAPVQSTRGSSDSIGVPEYTELRQALSVRDTIAQIPTPPPQYVPDVGYVRSSSHTACVPTGHQPSRAALIESWKSEVDSARTVRIGSDSSDEQNKINLRSVDPVKYKFCKLYPMDPEAFKMYTYSEMRQSTDVDRTTKLLTGARNIIGFRGDQAARHDKQRKYFLSVLRVHNHAVSQKAQLSSNVRVNTLEKLTIRIYGDDRKVDEDINETARLLRAFQIESWFVGIDKRVPRSSDASSDVLVTPDHSYDEVRAKMMLAFGPLHVKDVVLSLITRAVPYIVDGVVVANAWAFNECLLTTAHVYEDRQVPHGTSVGIAHQPEEDDVIVFKSSVAFPVNVTFRTPKDVESVYYVTYDRLQKEVIVIGDYELFYSTGVAYTQCVLEKGHSGALAVSVADGAVLGMYAHYFDGGKDTGMSLVIPSDKFSHLL